jgi:CRISPR-associated exonuclease Cas4
MLNKNITATDIMNHHYCPRINYYVHVLRIPQATTTKEYQGRKKYDEFKDKSKRNKIIPELPTLPRKYDVYLECNGIATRTDCILFDRNEAMPVQVKYASRPAKTHQTTYHQLLLEAFLIETILEKKVKQGFIKYQLSGGVVHVKLSESNKIRNTIEKIKEYIQSERLPKPTLRKKRCTDCCYKKLCWWG